ncbi:hypothetical protein [Nonomuraea soli]|uniref:Uncharacterized protein n=1 Tax=Nonomuraea soli TaxID=1032476 RepID=A0A7W0CQL3_9ACTN|nr:hypothetical protein [Nonomuraea soli]MBA2895325.1 hypothetical protein [Nonomuraea soli]
MTKRKILTAGLALALLGIVAPTSAQAQPARPCELPPGTPSYVVCTWLATPEEAAEIAKFWLGNDGQNLVDASPYPGVTVDCGPDCAPGAEGDGQPHDDGDPDVPPGEVDDPPKCADGTSGSCAIDPAAIAKAAASAQGQTIKSIAEHGMRVWIDTELADDWKAGKLAEAVQRVGALAAQPGVVGIRFTSQLGYNQNLATTEEIEKFVGETSAALRAALPGKKLAAHTVLPVLGCGGSDVCKTELTEKYPLLNPDTFGAFLSRGQIDQLGLDNGHLATEYTAWNIEAADAQRNQWIEVRARAWDSYGHIAAEDAVLTAPGSSQLTEDQATKAITDRVVAPLQADAAESVVLWTRWQAGDGTVHRVLGEKLADNATWGQLRKLTAVKPRLATIYDPATPEVDAATDLKKLAEVFGQVYLRSE